MISIKRIYIVLGFLIALIGSAFLFNSSVQTIEAQPINGNGDNHVRVCFCHNVNHNPHTICTDDRGEIRGHSRHVRNGQDTLGRCERPTPTPTEEPEFHSVCRENSCVLVGGEGESDCKVDEDCQPEVTPTPEQPKTDTTDHNSPGSYSAPTCTVEVPKLASNTQPTRIGDHISVNWQHDGTNISKWSINYGLDKDNMPMGIPSIIREAREVDFLAPWSGHTWIALCGYNGNDCASCTVFDP